MKLVFFGRLRDAIGRHEMDCSVPANVGNSESLRQWISGDYPVLLDPKVRIALDNVLISGAVPIAGVAEVAFLPPVSGG